MQLCLKDNHCTFQGQVPREAPSSPIQQRCWCLGGSGGCWGGSSWAGSWGTTTLPHEKHTIHTHIGALGKLNMSLAGYLEPGYPPRQTKSRRKHPRAQRQPWGSCHHLPPFIAGGVYPCCESCTQETRATACAGANLDVKGGSGAITPPGPKQQFVPKPGLNTLHLLSLNPAGPGGHLAALWAQVGVMWGLLLAGGGPTKV